MSQQQQQQESSTGTSTGRARNISQTKLTGSEDRNIETITEDLKKNNIKKLGITENMESTDVKRKLLNNFLEEEFEKYVKQGKFIKDSDGTYSYEGYKRLTKKQLITSFLKENEQVYKDKVNKIYESVQEIFKQNTRKQRITELNASIAKRTQTIQNLTSQREQLVEKIEKTNEKKLDAMYKQSKLETQMRNEMVQQQFQADTMGVKYEQLKQGLQSQIIQKEGLISQNQGQIQRATQNAEQTRQHMASLRQQYEATKLQHRDTEQQTRLMQQANAIASETLQQSIALRNDLNSNFSSLSTLVRDAAVAQIQTMERGFGKLSEGQQQLAEGQQRQLEATERGTQQLVEGQQRQLELTNQAAIANQQGQQAIVDEIRGNAAQISALNQSVNSLNTTMNDLTARVGDVSEKIGDLTKQLPPALSGTPPGCGLTNLPIGCTGRNWILTPIYTRAIRIGSRQQNIQIYRCDAGGHFCASDVNSGNWSDLPYFYYNLQ